MSMKVNISGGPLDVPLLDQVVEDGETVEVPDFQPAHNPGSAPGDPDHLPIVWPPDKWGDPAAAKTTAKASTKTADDTSGKAM